MARLSTPPSQDRATSSRGRWLALVAGVIGLGVVAVVAIAMLPSPDPVPVSTPKRPPPVRPAQPEPALSPELQAAATPAPKLAPAPAPKPEPARPPAPVAEARMGADGVLAVPLVVPMHSSTIPVVRISAGARGVRLLLDVPVPSNLDGVTVSVRGPEGRVAARLTRTSDGHGLAVELGAALQPGVHELLVTNDDETTLAHHRFDAAPAGAGP
jgi:hypothetical protein